MKALSLAFLASMFVITGYAQSKTFDHRLYKLQYDPAWAIDIDDPDYDPDSYFAIDASDDAVFILSIFEAKMELGELLDAYLASFKENVIPEPKSETGITSWGQFKGRGKILKGESTAGTSIIVRIFCWTENDVSFASVIQMNEGDEEKYKKGFDLIEKSFTVKK